MTIDHTPRTHHVMAPPIEPIVRASTLPPAPWRNGAGVTRRIASGKTALDDIAPPDWTVSLADIETDCAFSLFPGMHRTAVVVGDDAVDLTVNGTTHTLALLDRIGFDGEDDVRATPTRRPTRLLNLMCRRDTCAGTLTLRNVRGVHTIGADDGVVLTVLAGSLTLGDQEIRRWDSVLLDGSPREVTGAATVAVAHIRPSTQESIS
ncbi:HutD family protein [Gordonia sp. OPL2]|uniref:HutD/Ves family protein n=1 Tax=Gordonia sp. OPL2 TaxID=2486274 RepID=UPI001655DC43|nr:HutD family protein [Gordonia sp. OPL2]ROZ88588.1 hypothetical protein EEB19_22020 [Gordonia sp. OPL2]